MEWRAYFAIDNEEFSYMTIRCSSYDEAREKAIRNERAIEGFTEAPVKFLDLFPVVTLADIVAHCSLHRDWDKIISGETILPQQHRQIGLKK